MSRWCLSQRSASSGFIRLAFPGKKKYTGFRNTKLCKKTDELYLGVPGFSVRLFLRSGAKLEEQLEFSLELADVDASLGLFTLEGTDSGGVWLSTTTSIAPNINDRIL